MLKLVLVLILTFTLSLKSGVASHTINSVVDFKHFFPIILSVDSLSAMSNASRIMQMLDLIILARVAS